MNSDGLDDRRAARRQGRRDLARDHGVREIPRRDDGADADRLLQHQNLRSAVGEGIVDPLILRASSANHFTKDAP